MISRMMLNLRDPSLIPVPEDQTYPNLTFVIPYCSTELSNRSGVSDRGNLNPHSREGLEDLDHVDAGKWHSFYGRVNYLKVIFFSLLGSSSHNNNIELDRIGV